MKMQGAVIKEQGITFAIALVKPSSVRTTSEAQSTRQTFQPIFPGLELVLACQEQGTFKYSGRRDIVNFLASVNPNRIPWREYSVTG
ncbi:hypothetical protein ACVWWJ_004049 [Luteibacter sp. HA06]